MCRRQINEEPACLVRLLLVLMIGFMPMQLVVAGLPAHVAGEQALVTTQKLCRGYDETKLDSVRYDHNHTANTAASSDSQNSDEVCACCYDQACNGIVCVSSCGGAPGGTMIPAHTSDLFNFTAHKLSPFHLLTKRELHISPPQRPPRTVTL